MRGNISGQCPRPAKKKTTQQALAGRAKSEHGTLTVIPTAGAIENINRLTVAIHAPVSFHASRSFGLLSIRSSSCSPRGFSCLVRGTFFLLIIGFGRSESERHTPMTVAV